MISNIAFKTSSTTAKAAYRGRASTMARRLQSSSAPPAPPTPSPARGAAAAMGKAVKKEDPRSYPRALVWVGAFGIIGSFAYKMMAHGEASSNDREHIIKTTVPPSSSSFAKKVVDELPMVEDDRARYEAIGKEGLGVDNKKTGKERTSLAD